MKKQEREFLELLEAKAQEQKRVVSGGVLPERLDFVGDWLSVHPWRVLMPVSGVLYLVFRALIGLRFVEMILGLFGGFR